RARSGRGGARPARLGTACLGERPPGLALAAPPDPLGRAPPALGADEPGARGLGGGLGAHPANLPAAPDTARSCAVTALGTRPDAAARPRCRRRPPSAGRPPRARHPGAVPGERQRVRWDRGAAGRAVRPGVLPGYSASQAAKASTE